MNMKYIYLRKYFKMLNQSAAEFFALNSLPGMYEKSSTFNFRDSYKDCGN